MQKSIFISCFIILSFLGKPVHAQEASDTWYVWIDTEVPIDGKMIKIVSKEPTVITCCPKSSKYRKFVKKTAKWITENISPTYDGELSLMKIQDKDLADQTVSQLNSVADVKVVELLGSCK